MKRVLWVVGGLVAGWVVGTGVMIGALLVLVAPLEVALGFTSELAATTELWINGIGVLAFIGAGGMWGYRRGRRTASKSVLKCPSCGVRGEVRETEETFEVRGQWPQGHWPVRKCKSCGAGLIVKPRLVPPGVRAIVIPDSTWAAMEVSWYRQFGAPSHDALEVDPPEPQAGSVEGARSGQTVEAPKATQRPGIADTPSASPAVTDRMVPLKWVLVGVGAIVALLAAFGIGMAVDSLDLHTDRDTDAEVMAEIQTHATAWNDVAGPLVEDYLDPNTSAMQWAEAAQFPIYELEAALSGIEYEAARLSDPDLQDFVSDVVANKTDKLTALTALMNAIESGDHNAELTAWSDLSAAAVDGRRLEQDLAGYPEE